MEKLRAKLIKHTHKRTVEYKGLHKEEKLEANPFELYVAMDKPNIYYQNGKFFGENELEIFEDELLALGFDPETKRYLPDSGVKDSIEKSNQQAAQIRKNRASRQSEA